MRKRTTVIGVVALMMVCFNSPAMTQEAGEGIQYSFGVVVKVSAKQIVLREYDYEKDQEIEITYMINPETGLNGVASIDEIKANDNVEIYFQEREGQKIAEVIAKEEAPIEAKQEDTAVPPAKDSSQPMDAE